MDGELREYYERELSYLHNTARDFAARYPKIASRLLLGEKENYDPHVERLLEGVAFLAARVHLKLDDDFPEITDALLNIVYPHYLRPVPSMTVAQFTLDPGQGKLTTGFRIPRESLVESRPVNGIPCRFRTCYDTVLWPLEIAEADWRTPDKVDAAARIPGCVGVLRLLVRCAPEVTWDRLGIDSLRLYLASEDLNLVPILYELLLNNCRGIVARDPRNPKRPPVRLGNTLRAVGYEEEEAILPYPKRSFDGYRLLHEYFAFPQKFHFLDVRELNRLVDAGFKEEAELLFFLSPFQRPERTETLERVNASSLRLGCAPVVNLFRQTSEPILIKHTEHEYPIIPDVRRQRGMDIFSVDDVFSLSQGATEAVHYAPYFAFRHSDEASRRQAFWYARRRESKWNESSATWLTLVDLSGRPLVPDVEAVTVRLTCTNASLPSRLPFGSADGDFQLEGGGPVRSIRALFRPTPSVSPKTGREAFWRLISHLSLNHLSLVSEGREAFQEILQLYNIGDSANLNRQIQSIRALGAEPHFARLVSEHGVSFARGYRVHIDIDEDGFAGAGVFLFASVLERFLGMYATLNSFSQLAVTTPQRKEVLRQWQPRAGRRILM